MTAKRSPDGVSSTDRAKTALNVSSNSTGIALDNGADRMSDYNRALVAYHIVVILWGFTAILGKLISYGSVMLVWHR
jgi:hypothetical protein